MLDAALSVGWLQALPMLVTLLAASAVFMPVRGDRFRYSVSSGEAVSLEVVEVKARGDQTIATVQEDRRLPGGKVATASFDIVRTDAALAVDMPPPAQNARLSPLVYFFAPATLNDSWLAQQGVFLDPRGNQVGYRITARVAAVETVTGPAGVFPDCRRVEFSSSLQQEVNLTVWLHPDVGIVRSYSWDGGVSRLTELVSYQKHST